MEKLQHALRTKKFKHGIFIALVIIMFGWVIYRFGMVAYENRRYVFNTARVAAESGMPVTTMTVVKQNGKLLTPIAIRNNRGYVSAKDVSKFKAGQKIGAGKIASVSKNIDYNTGLHLVKTTGVNDGIGFVEFVANGYFVPLYAINDNSVMVSVDSIAQRRDVNIAGQDSENAYITSGLSDGDIVILSTVHAGQLVQIKK